MSRFVDQFFIQITGPKDYSGSSGGPAVLVFLHGIMGYAMNWRRIAKAFEDRYRVVVYDSRGHGRSSHADLKLHPDAYTPEALAEDLRGILDDLGIDKAILIGHSMGGRVAYTFAANHPNRVQALVIEDIGPSMSHSGSDMVSQILDRVPTPFATKRFAKEWFEVEFAGLFADRPLSERPHPGLAPWLYANIEEKPDGTADWRFHKEGIRAGVIAGRERERWDVLAKIVAPTLVVRGENSKDLSRADFEKMLRQNTSFSGVEIADAGHWVHSERPDEFIAELDKFLRSLTL